MTTAYPLAWPIGWKRTAQAQRAPYRFGRKSGAERGASDEAAKRELLRQLRLLNARSVVLSTNIPLRQDGLPFSNRRAPDDTGVAVYFVLHDRQQRCIPCDKWDRVADNLYAVARTIDALRQLDRDGTKGIVEAAFSGFKALPATGGTSGANWWDVLGVHPEGDLEVIEDAYRQLARKLHPDVGGERGPWDELQAAIHQARQARGKRAP